MRRLSYVTRISFLRGVTFVAAAVVAVVVVAAVAVAAVAFVTVLLLPLLMPSFTLKKSFFSRRLPCCPFGQ